jgi:hypothetical protein
MKVASLFSGCGGLDLGLEQVSKGAREHGVMRHRGTIAGPKKQDEREKSASGATAAARPPHHPARRLFRKKTH